MPVTTRAIVVDQLEGAFAIADRESVHSLLDYLMDVERPLPPVQAPEKPEKAEEPAAEEPEPPAEDAPVVPLDRSKRRAASA